MSRVTIQQVMIRDAGAADLAGIRDVIAATDKKLLWSFERDWARASQTPESRKFLVADHGEIIVGITGYSSDAWGASDIWWLVWLYVLPSYRRKGVASLLFEKAQQELRDLGCRKCYLDVGDLDTQADAVTFHEHDGFRLEGSLLDYWGDGSHHHIFGKRLC